MRQETRGKVQKTRAKRQESFLSSRFQRIRNRSVFCLLVFGFWLVGLEVAEAQKPDTTLLKYKLSPKEGTMAIKEKEKWKTYMLEDILGKKVYTKGIAASRFGGEREIELEKEALIRHLKVPPPLIKELPPEVKRKAEEIRREVKMGQAKVEFETIRPEIKPGIEEKAAEVKSITLPTEEKEAMKLAAIKALGVIKTESAVFYLKESLNEERPEIKRAAAEALAKIGEPAGLEALHTALEEEGVSTKVEAIRALGRVGRVTSIPPLRKMLGSEERKVSREAAIALAKIGDERGIAILHSLLSSESFDERFEAAVALAEIDDPGGIEVLKKNLKGTQREIRLKAVTALGLIGDKSIIPLLEELLKRDPDSGVRIAASESILRIKRRGK